MIDSRFASVSSLSVLALSSKNICREIPQAQAFKSTPSLDKIQDVAGLVKTQMERLSSIRKPVGKVGGICELIQYHLTIGREFKKLVFVLTTNSTA
mmetsp:Transcript_5659/g.11309  ORF Transcript_5659/g.11309 Transcript_5659/m.11309 type:complete len:96 (+) Transcript_5659:765-1052(+)